MSSGFESEEDQLLQLERQFSRKSDLFLPCVPAGTVFWSVTGPWVNHGDLRTQLWAAGTPQSDWSEDLLCCSWGERGGAEGAARTRRPLQTVSDLWPLRSCRSNRNREEEARSHRDEDDWRWGMRSDGKLTFKWRCCLHWHSEIKISQLSRCCLLGSSYLWEIQWPSVSC